MNLALIAGGDEQIAFAENAMPQMYFWCGS